MNRRTLWMVLLSVFVLVIAGCGGSGHRHATITVTISSAPTTLAVGASGNVAATTNDTAGVTWSCTPAPACGAFSFSPDATMSAATSAFTAPPAIPSGAQVTITATSATNTAVSAQANITITASTVATNNFVFYASGEENDANGDLYSIAGVVAIASDGSGTVIGGEQDFNDGDINTSPQPSGDFITGGTLTIAANGQAILTLITNNPNLGVSGTETFALAFSNANHAVISQFDAGAASIGSFDLQSATAAPVSAAFSFVANGADSTGAPTAFGGVLAADASGNLTGTFDQNDAGVPTLATAVPAGAALGVTDSLGRGTVTGSITGNTTINYYVVGPEVLRIVEVDAASTAVGSVYGQGATPNFSAASIGTSVFSVGSSLSLYAAAGRFTTDGASTFAGVGDENESVLNANVPVLAGAFNGTYTMASDGYGALLFTNDLGSISDLGVYAVDSTLNILDPNRPLDSGNGGALIAEMDSLVGTGALVPQIDINLGSVSSAVTFGGQGDTATNSDEFDFVGEGNMAAGVLAGTGALSDPFGALTTTLVDSPNGVFDATFTDDGTSVGRSTATLAVTSSAVPVDFVSPSLLVTAYQANNGQLFWVEVDDLSFFGGSIQTNTFAVAAVRKAAKPKK